MKRFVKYLGVIAAVVSAGCLLAMAGQPSLGAITPGDVYLKADIWKNVDSATIALPAPIESGMSASASESGPIALPPAAKGGVSSFGAASSAVAIPGAHMGSFLSPQERTGISVKKTIRNLG